MPATRTRAAKRAKRNPEKAKPDKRRRPAAKATRSPEARNKALARSFLAAVSRADADAIVAAYAPDGVCWTAGSMPISGSFGVEQIRAASLGVLGAFPNGLAFTIHAMTAEGDRVAIEAESRGEHASGKLYNNKYHFLMRIRDGKIAEWREYMDTMHANDVLCGGGS